MRIEAGGSQQGAAPAGRGDSAGSDLAGGITDSLVRAEGWRRYQTGAARPHLDSLAAEAAEATRPEDRITAIEKARRVTNGFIWEGFYIRHLDRLVDASR